MHIRYIGARELFDALYDGLWNRMNLSSCLLRSSMLFVLYALTIFFLRFNTYRAFFCSMLTNLHKIDVKLWDDLISTINFLVYASWAV